jgi:hypothetical protein
MNLYDQWWEWDKPRYEVFWIWSDTPYRPELFEGWKRRFWALTVRHER